MKASCDQCPASEVRETSRHPSGTNFGSKGALASILILVPLIDLKFLRELAANGAGTSNRRHQPALVGNELHYRLDPGSGLQIGEYERTRPAHLLCVPLHDIERSADIGRE